MKIERSAGVLLMKINWNRKWINTCWDPQRRTKI